MAAVRWRCGPPLLRGLNGLSGSSRARPRSTTMSPGVALLLAVLLFTGSTIGKWIFRVHLEFVLDVRRWCAYLPGATILEGPHGTRASSPPLPRLVLPSTTCSFLCFFFFFSLFFLFFFE